MKTRNGWVSNSSSSSFILAVKSENNLSLSEFFNKYYEDIMEIEGFSMGARYLREIKTDLIDFCFCFGLDNPPRTYKSLEDYKKEYFSDNTFDARFWPHGTTKEDHDEMLERELEMDQEFCQLRESFKDGFDIVHLFELRHSGDGPNAYEEGLCYAIRDKDTTFYRLKKIY